MQINKAISETAHVWLFLSFAEYFDSTEKHAIEFQEISTYAIEYTQKKQISWENHITKTHYTKKHL